MRPSWYIYEDENDGAGGDVGGGAGSGDGGGKDIAGAGDGDGGGKDGDDDGGDRGKTGLLAGAGKKGDGDGGGDAGDGDDKGTASGDGEKGKTTINLLSMDERPEWLPENYYDKENKGVHLQSLVKAERDLRTKVAESNKGKPKSPDKAADYTFVFDGSTVKDDKGTVILAPGGKPHTVAADDPIVRAFAEAAHTEGLTQSQFQNIADKVQRQLILYTNEKYEFYDESVELERLGEGGKPLMEGIHTWLGGLQARGTISQAEFNEAMELGKFASGIRFLNKMRTLTGEQAIPLGNEHLLESDQLSDEALHTLVGTELYDKDPAEQERVRGLFVKRYGTAPGGASPKGLGVHTKPMTNKPVKRA